MKKIILPALALAITASCSDKNDDQPKLAHAQRMQLNQNIMPQMIGGENAMPQSGIMNMQGMQPMPNQAEVFVNDQVAFGTAPSAFPGNNQNMGIPSSASLLPSAPMQQQMAPQNMMAPQAMMAQPMAAQEQNNEAYLPPEITGSDAEPPITYVTNRQNVPASLRPTYTNPLRKAAGPQAIQRPMMGAVAPVFNLQQQMPTMQQAQPMPPMMMMQPMLMPMAPETMGGQPIMPQMGQPQQQAPEWQKQMMIPSQMN